MKILIVDDNPDFLKLIKYWLLDTEHEFETVSGSYSCLNKLLHNKYDLVIVDLYLPEMGGIKLIKTIKNRYDQKVLLITAENFDFDILPQIKYKFKKPTTKKDFLQLIEKTKDQV